VQTWQPEKVSIVEHIEAGFIANKYFKNDTLLLLTPRRSFFQTIIFKTLPGPEENLWQNRFFTSSFKKEFIFQKKGVLVGAHDDQNSDKLLVGYHSGGIGNFRSK
jgi:hypothetical protein